MFTKEPSKEENLVRDLTSIICINQTENKYYVYSENGILVNRINFNAEMEQYGQIVAMSNNGLTLVFKKSHEELMDMCTSPEHSHPD